MGQKVNPHGLRVGVIKGWDAQWYAGKKEFSDFLIEDYKIREYIKNKYFMCGIAKTTIERAQGKVIINVYTPSDGACPLYQNIAQQGENSARYGARKIG